MATLKIYARTSGMQESIDQIDQLIAEQRKVLEANAVVRNAHEMLAAEERNQAQSRDLADLLTAKQILLAHMDQEVLARSYAAGRARLRAEGAKGIKSGGWKWTSVVLRGGTRLKFETPYIRRSLQGQRGAKRQSRREGGAGLHPVLLWLGFEERLSPATYSEVARQTVLAGSYDEAREGLARQGLELDVSTMTSAAVRVGQKALELRDASISAAIEAELPEQSSLAGKRVRISLDGGRTRTRRTRYGRGIRPGKNGRRPFVREWIEPRVLTIDLLDEQGEVDRSQRPIYGTTLEKADAAMRMVLGTLRLLGVHLAREVLFVADGTDWIWNRIEKTLLDAGVPAERLTLVLDYYHATQYIDAALSLCKDMRLEARKALFEQLCRRMLEPGGPEAVIEQLRSLARGRRAAAIHKELRYLETRLELMRYAEVRERKLSIGSGVVESAVRRLINLRFKAASICWKTEHLAPLLELRAIAKSGRWDQFFSAQLRHAHYLEPATAFASSAGTRRTASKPRRQAA
jgi:hypothetical protein